MTGVTTEQVSVAAPRTAPEDLAGWLEQHRPELTGYCYRMLGSAFDAEDAVQETLVRAWKGLEKFEGRSAVRSWLYRIATNVCLDMLAGRKRRAMPMDLSESPSAPVQSSLGEPVVDGSWLEPVSDVRALATAGDPADVAVARDSIRLAFVAALQHLPPRQRAVLILREVLRWKADETAELLETTVASVNSALQRARATLASERLTTVKPSDPLDDEHRALLDRYVRAFEAYDIAALVALLHEDATQSMPPFRLWLQGPADIGQWHLGPGGACRGSRMVEIRANGQPAFAQYKPGGAGGRLEPWAIHVLTVSAGKITGITNFLGGPDLFALFDAPPFLEP